MGHAIIYGEVGVPDPGTEIGEYYGFHESAADLVALISSLHFETLVDHLLIQTRGNLYSYNSLSRIVELAPNRQIRIAANDVQLSAFKNGWRNEHTLSLPLTAPFFDIFVDIFHEILKTTGLITPFVEDLSDKLLATPAYASVMQAHFDTLFARNPRASRRPCWRRVTRSVRISPRPGNASTAITLTTPMSPTRSRPSMPRRPRALPTPHSCNFANARHRQRSCGAAAGAVFSEKSHSVRTGRAYAGAAKWLHPCVCTDSVRELVLAIKLRVDRYDGNSLSTSNVFVVRASCGRPADHRPQKKVPTADDIRVLVATNQHVNINGKLNSPFQRTLLSNDSLFFFSGRIITTTTALYFLEAAKNASGKSLLESSRLSHMARIPIEVTSMSGEVIRGKHLHQRKRQRLFDCKGSNTFAVHRESPGAQGQLQKQLENDLEPKFARIYGFAFEGTYYELPSPILFLVHGDGTEASLPPLGRASVTRHACRTASITGIAAADYNISDDVRVWSYDKGDFSIRMDVETGMIEDILLARSSAVMAAAVAAVFQVPKVSGANVFGREGAPVRRLLARIVRPLGPVWTDGS